MFSLNAGETRGTQELPASAHGTNHPRRRVIIALTELLLLSLVCLSTIARQPYTRHTRTKWHTVKASKMVERSAKLVLEAPRNNAPDNLVGLDRPEIISPIPEVTFHPSPRTFPILTLRSPPLA